MPKEGRERKKKEMLKLFSGQFEIESNQNISRPLQTLISAKNRITAHQTMPHSPSEEARDGNQTIIVAPSTGKLSENFGSNISFFLPRSSADAHNSLLSSRGCLHCSSAGSRGVSVHAFRRANLLTFDRTRPHSRQFFLPSPAQIREIK